MTSTHVPQRLTRTAITRNFRDKSSYKSVLLIQNIVQTSLTVIIWNFMCLWFFTFLAPKSNKWQRQFHKFPAHFSYSQNYLRGDILQFHYSNSQFFRYTNTILVHSGHKPSYLLRTKHWSSELCPSRPKHTLLWTAKVPHALSEAHQLS